MQRTDASLVLETTGAHMQFCAYEHQVQFEAGKPPVVIFVGSTKLVDVYRMIEARRNSEWLRILGKGGQVLVRIIATTPDKNEARRYAMEHVRSLPEVPMCNLRGISIKGMARRVRCSNGETYETQLAAAQALGVSASAISRLLRGELNTVGGYTFAYA